ncbi:hypothetical protein P154DRAFT_517152 [Amniculicola lignicola CBS 123094]|uniref:Uncharacterized protein n=1 Tax=Amniculicola lignicola CBS 123094 TaxID=1392246 RepID=A0A6A5X3C7_9PLEO|nr:hypothetical protein P154DRAFT_517152 [Amniculicola lignicola CBS 123094]
MVSPSPSPINPPTRTRVSLYEPTTTAQSHPPHPCHKAAYNPPPAPITRSEESKHGKVAPRARSFTGGKLPYGYVY